MKSRFHDYTFGAEFDSPACPHHVTSTLVVPRSWAPCLPSSLYQAPLSSMPSSQDPYPSYSPNPYHVYIDQYNKLNATQHTAQMISHDENRVSVLDGHSWKEYNLEKIFSR